jgi:hypothetical protein
VPQELSIPSRGYKWAVRDGRSFGTSQNHAARMAADIVKNELNFFGLVWTSAIVGRVTAFWMKRAKSFWNRKWQRHRKR